MKIIDLSLPLYTGMPVFPWDPEAKIEPIQTVESDGWNILRLQINSQDATHVNVPYHSEPQWKKLDEYHLDAFMWISLLYEVESDLQEGVGVIFSRENITQQIAEKIIEKKVKFVWLSSNFEFDLDVEKILLKHGIISFERLTNCDQLPKKFFFHGAPLSIKHWDGSPVRAYAICYDEN